MSLETAHIGVIRQTFAALGADLPKPVTAAVAEFDKLTTAGVPIATSTQIGDAVADCLLDGRDPLADDHVRALVLSQSLGGSTGTNLDHIVRLAAERRVIAAYRASVDTILATLGKHADHAGQQLADAFALIGDNDLSDTQLVLSLGPDAARAWAEARNAVALLRKIDGAWHALASVTQFAATSGEQSLRLADLDLDQLEKVGRRADAWAIVRAGGQIDLADATTIRERTDRTAQARQQREQNRVNAPRDEYRRLHGAGARS